MTNKHDEDHRMSPFDTESLDDFLIAILDHAQQEGGMTPQHYLTRDLHHVMHDRWGEHVSGRSGEELQHRLGDIVIVVLGIMGTAAANAVQKEHRAMILDRMRDELNKRVDQMIADDRNKQ